MPTSSSVPGRLDIEAYKGDVFRRSITVTAGGTAYDFTGADANLQVRQFRDSADPPLLELTVADGITLGGAAGTIEIVAAATTMADDSLLAARVYDLEITPDGGETFTLLTGKFSVSADVTR